jgi:hypothetical protein
MALSKGHHPQLQHQNPASHVSGPNYKIASQTGHGHGQGQHQGDGSSGGFSKKKDKNGLEENIRHLLEAKLTQSGKHKEQELSEQKRKTEQMSSIYNMLYKNKMMNSYDVKKAQTARDVTSNDMSNSVNRIMNKKSKYIN